MTKIKKNRQCNLINLTYVPFTATIIGVHRYTLHNYLFYFMPGNVLPVLSMVYGSPFAVTYNICIGNFSFPFSFSNDTSGFVFPVRLRRPEMRSQLFPVYYTLPAPILTFQVLLDSGVYFYKVYLNGLRHEIRCADGF